MQNNKSSRVPLLDELRGIAIILMVFYHLGYDLVAIFGVDIPFFFSPGINFLRNVIAGTFMFISGTCCHFSRNNLKRGAVTFLFGMVMTAATALIIPEQIILFGVLHMLGASMMLYALLSKLLSRIRPGVGIAVSLALFLALYSLPYGSLGIFAFKLPVPRLLYESAFLFPIGLPSIGFFSSDYYPLVPWFFLFLAGSFTGVFVREHKLPDMFYRGHSKALAFVGRNTIYVYLLHQPVIYFVLTIIFK